MRTIKAQLSSDILRNIIPLNAIDSSREALTPKEADTLYGLWKDEKNINGKVMNPVDFDRIVLASLKSKGLF